MKGINILLVEDNEAHVELILRGLRKGNPAQEIHVVKDGQEAVDFLFHTGRFGNKQRFPRPNLIILDLKLHKVDGIEVLKRVRTDRELKKVPVVVFSSSGYQKDIEAAYKSGASGYIIKPIDPGEFQQRLRDLGTYLAQNDTIRCKD